MVAACAVGLSGAVDAPRQETGPSAEWTKRLPRNRAGGMCRGWKGFGARAGQATCGRRFRSPRWTRVGVSRPGSAGFSHERHDAAQLDGGDLGDVVGGAEQDWLTLERPPAYAPELNPVELLGSVIKTRELANLVGDHLVDAADAAERGVLRVCSSEQLPWSFLTHTGLTIHSQQPASSQLSSQGCRPRVTPRLRHNRPVRRTGTSAPAGRYPVT